MIQKEHIQNFETLRQAFLNNDVALIECNDVKTNAPVIVMAMVNKHKDGSVDFVPVAKMFNGNPYEELTPPTQH